MKASLGLNHNHISAFHISTEAGLEYIEPDVLWEYESKCGRGSIKDFLVNPLCVAPPSFSAPASIQADLWVLEQASRCPSQYIWHNSDFIWNLSVFRRQLYTCTFEEVLPKTVPEHVCEQNSWNWDRLVASSHRLGGSCFACWDKRGVIIRWWARWPIMFFRGLLFVSDVLLFIFICCIFSCRRVSGVINSYGKGGWGIHFLVYP